MKFDESKHPRYDDGKFKDKNSLTSKQRFEKEQAERERLARKYDSDRQSETRKPPKATSFNRPDTKHHLKHAAEMGLNEKQYIKAATEFFNSGKGEMYFDDRRKVYVRCDYTTMQVCTCDNAGNVKTFFQTTKKKLDAMKKQDEWVKL